MSITHSRESVSEKDLEVVREYMEDVGEPIDTDDVVKFAEEAEHTELSREDYAKAALRKLLDKGEIASAPNWKYKLI